jgi:hypothetical protein
MTAISDGGRARDDRRTSGGEALGSGTPQDQDIAGL